MIRIEGGRFKTICDIANRMRMDDRVELAATSPQMSSAVLARGIMAKAELVFVARYNGVPAACWGMMPMWPGVGYAFAFGTDDWGKVLIAVTRFVRGFMVSYLLDNGYHRIEARSLATRSDVGRWLEIFGAEAEAVLRGSGARGEDFVLYRWLSDEHQPAQIQGTTSDRHSPGDRRRRRRADHVGDDVAAREPDLPQAVSMRSTGDGEISARVHQHRRMPAHRGRA